MYRPLIGLYIHPHQFQYANPQAWCHDLSQPRALHIGLHRRPRSCLTEQTRWLTQPIPIAPSPVEKPLELALPKPSSIDRFEQLAAQLTHESQTKLKSFVLWLGKRQGEEITFKQIQDNWAKNNGVGRGKEVLMPLIYLAKSQRLLTFLPNRNWRVNS